MGDAGMRDREVQGAAAVKKGGLNLDTRARYGRHGVGIMWRNHPKLLGPGALIFVAKQL